MATTIFYKLREKTTFSSVSLFSLKFKFMILVVFISFLLSAAARKRKYVYIRTRMLQARTMLAFSQRFLPSISATTE